MKVKPKEVLVNVPVVLLFDDKDSIPELASNFNTFLHGKVKLKYEEIGILNGQFVAIFYLQRGDEFQQLRDQFSSLIEQEEMMKHPAPKSYVPSCTRCGVDGYDDDGTYRCSICNQILG
jgi:hypothetical protein